MLALGNIILSWWGSKPKTYIAILQCDPLSFYTKLEGPSIAKLDFYFPRYNFWMIFMLTTLGMCVKQPLLNPMYAMIEFCSQIGSSLSPLFENLQIIIETHLT